MAVSLRDARGSVEDRRWFVTAYARWLREFGGDAVMAVVDHGQGSAVEALDALAQVEARQWLASTEGDVILSLRDGQPTGFALIRRESATTRCVAEFYIEPGERGRGVGRAAAMLIFDRFGGEWRIATLQRQASAVRFWRGTVRAYTAGRHQETLVAGEVRQRFLARPALVPDREAVGAIPGGRSNGAR